MARRARRRVVCSCCGREGTYGAFGWRSTCYSRWLNAGRPEDGPPAPYSARRNGLDAARAVIEARIETRRARVAVLARNPANTSARIGACLGVSGRTVERDRAALAAQPPGGPMPNQAAPVGHDFAYRRDLSDDVADLLPEHLATAVGKVEKYARDDAEERAFLEMLGLAPYASGDRGQYGNRHRAKAGVGRTADGRAEHVLNGAA